MMFDPKDIEADPKYGQMYQTGEPQYLRDQRLIAKLRKLVKAKESEFTQEADTNVLHSYNQLETETLETMLKTGQINRSEFETARA